MIFKNDKIKATAEIFEKQGGQFIKSPTEIGRKLKKARAFIFDWDGVFNSGIKSNEQSSGFGEPDAMGLHILRYAYWRITGKIPAIAIVTAQKNESAVKFAKREHLSEVFTNFKDKYIPVNKLIENYGIKKTEIVSIFDDIIDYPLADETGLRFLINRNASPLFKNYFIENKLCDYVTANQQPNYPIREICELAAAFIDNYDKMLVSRFTNKKEYEKYTEAKASIETNLIEE